LIAAQLGSLITGNPIHLHAGFAQFHRQVVPIRMAQAVLQLHGQNPLAHPQIHLLQGQEDHELIKRLKKGFMLFGPGDRGAHLSGVITPDGTPVGASSVMASRASPSASAKAVRLSSHAMMAPSRL
jgi:hypothetical protein